MRASFSLGDRLQIISGDNSLVLNRFHQDNIRRNVITTIFSQASSRHSPALALSSRRDGALQWLFDHDGELTISENDFIQLRRAGRRSAILQNYWSFAFETPLNARLEKNHSNIEAWTLTAQVFLATEEERGFDALLLPHNNCICLLEPDYLDATRKLSPGWHQVAIVKYGSLTTQYIDGVELSSIISTERLSECPINGICSSTANHPGHSQLGWGSIAYIRVHNSALNPHQINNLAEESILVTFLTQTEGSLSVFLFTFSDLFNYMSLRALIATCTLSRILETFSSFRTHTDASFLLSACNTIRHLQQIVFSRGRLGRTAMLPDGKLLSDALEEEPLSNYSLKLSPLLNELGSKPALTQSVVSQPPEAPSSSTVSLSKSTNAEVISNHLAEDGTDPISPRTVLITKQKGETPYETREIRLSGSSSGYHTAMRFSRPSGEWA